MRTCQVCAPDRDSLLAALRLPGKDYEDAVQVVSAQSAALDALVTRDPADYEDRFVSNRFSGDDTFRSFAAIRALGSQPLFWVRGC
jgi:hypothetical protein